MHTPSCDEYICNISYSRKTCLTASQYLVWYPADGRLFSFFFFFSWIKQARSKEKNSISGIRKCLHLSYETKQQRKSQVTKKKKKDGCDKDISRANSCYSLCTNDQPPLPCGHGKGSQRHGRKERYKNTSRWKKLHFHSLKWARLPEVFFR